MPSLDVPDSQHFATKVAEFSDAISDYFLENSRYVLGEPDERAFLEVCKQVLLLGEKAHTILGDLVLLRLTNIHGAQALAEDKFERPVRSTIAAWAATLDVPYHRLTRLIGAAKTRNLVAATSELPITAQHEIGMNAGDSDEERAEKIGERLEQLDHVDPARENSVEGVRDIKKSERVGIERVAMVYHQDLERGGISVDGLMGTGSFEPVAYLEWFEPKDGMLKEQFQFYRELIMKKLPAQHRDPLPFDPGEEEQ